MSDPTFPILRAKRATEKKWTPSAPTLKELRDVFTFHVANQDKDGPAFVPAAIVGAQRIANAVTHVSMLVYDIDGEQSFQEVVNLVRAAKAHAFVYTTYSHRTKVTHIKTDHYVKWAQKSGKPDRHTPEAVADYLEAKGKVLTNLTVDEKPVHTANGFCIVARHDPIEKTRVVFPLKEIYDMSAHGGYTSAEHRMGWKRRYVGVAEKIGLKFDITCSDPARLFYFPSHPPGADKYETLEIEGPFLDILAYELADVSRIGEKDTKDSYTADGSALTRTQNTIHIGETDFNDWFRKNARGVGPKLLELIEENPALSAIRSDRGEGKNGKHIECPYEDEHSKAGGEGTFLDPGEDDEAYPKVFCCHQHCEGRTTEDFIAKMIESGWFVFDDLKNAARQALLERSGLGSVAAAERSSRGAWYDVVEFNAKATDNTADAEAEEETIAADLIQGADKPVSESVELFHSLLGSKTPVLSDAYFQKIRAATTSLEIYKVYDEMARETGQNSIGLFMYMLCMSGASIAVLRHIFVREKDKIGLGWPEFKAMLREARRKKFSLDSIVEQFASSSLQNHELNRKIEETADFFDFSFREVQLAYRSAFVHSSSSAEKELREKAAKLNNELVKVYMPSGVYYVDRRNPCPSGDNNVRTYAQNTLNSMYSNANAKIVLADGKIKEVNILDWWTKYWPNPTSCSGVAFMPDKPPLRVVDGRFNSFEGFHFDTVKGNASPFIDHIRNVWCRGDDELANWVITWFAHMIQFPATKGSTSLVVRGGQGTGKSFIFEHCIEHILRPYAYISARDQDLVGNFNSHLARTILFVAEESAFARSRKTFSRIKGLITQQIKAVEAKGRDTMSAPDFTRYVFLTNDRQAIHAEEDDRRFVVLDTGRVVDHGSPAEFTAKIVKLIEWFRNGGVAIVAHLLKTWDPHLVGLNWESVNRAPLSEAKIDQKQRASKVSAEGFIADMVLYGRIPGQGGQSNEWNIDNIGYLDVEASLENYEAWSRRTTQGHGDPFDWNAACEFLSIDYWSSLQRVGGRLVLELPVRRDILAKLVEKKLYTQHQIDNMIRLGTTDA